MRQKCKATPNSSCFIMTGDSHNRRIDDVIYWQELPNSIFPSIKFAHTYDIILIFAPSFLGPLCYFLLGLEGIGLRSFTFGSRLCHFHFFTRILGLLSHASLSVERIA